MPAHVPRACALLTAAVAMPSCRSASPAVGRCAWEASACVAQVSRLRYSAANRKMGQAVEGKQLLWGSLSRLQCLCRTSMTALQVSYVSGRPAAQQASVRHCRLNPALRCPHTCCLQASGAAAPSAQTFCWTPITAVSGWLGTPAKRHCSTFNAHNARPQCTLCQNMVAGEASVPTPAARQHHGPSCPYAIPPAAGSCGWSCFGRGSGMCMMGVCQ